MPLLVEHTLYASTPLEDDSQTRTQVSVMNYKKILWSAHESISILSGGGNYPFVGDNDQPDAEAGFTGEGPADLGNYIALYPYNASASYDGDYVSTTLPGLFDYSRYNGFIDIAGMDVDCTALNPAIVPYSLCVNNNLALGNYLEDWLSGTPWPEHQQFGLESEFVQVVPNPQFTFAGQDMPALYQEFYSRAVEKETAYVKE